MSNQRGEPIIPDVVSRIKEIWELVPELSFVRFIGNVLSAAGYPADQWNNVLFMGWLDDAGLLRALDEFERIIKETS